MGLWATTPVQPVSRIDEVVFVAGPNGSGKSTAVEQYVQQRFAHLPYLNADRVAERLRAERFDGDSRALLKKAADEVDGQVFALLAAAKPFVVETVLSSPKYRPALDEGRRRALVVRLVYITTLHADVNVQRVRERVAKGGHDVPEKSIRERWVRSMDQLPWFAERSDRVLVVDNSGPQPVAIALRHLDGPLIEVPGQGAHPAVQRLRAVFGTVVGRRTPR